MPRIVPKTAEPVKPKTKCCKDRPRCKRCPVVLGTLERQGLATLGREGSYILSPELKKRQLKAARQR